MRNVRVASVQFESVPRDKPANLAIIANFVAKAAGKGAEIVAFPECCITGYWFLRNMTQGELQAISEPLDGVSAKSLLALAKQYKITIGAGLVETGKDGALYNTYLVAMPDGQLKHHRKIHAFESDYISSGDSITVFDTPHGCRVGVLICYDNNIIENVRMTALAGAEILLAPHQTGGCGSGDVNIMGLVDRKLWDERRSNRQAIEDELRGPKGRGWLMRWLPARAHDSGIFVVFSNGVGIDDDEIRTGNAMIIDTYGRILAETWAPEDAMVVADLDASLRGNSTGERWITTRRPDLYKPLSVPTGKEQDVRKVRFDKKGA